MRVHCFRMHYDRPTSLKRQKPAWKRFEIGYWNYLKDALQLEGQVKRRTTNILYKAVGSGIFGRFPNEDNSRSEVADDVISGVALDCVGVDVRATFGESRLNSGRIILLFCRPDLFNCLLQPTESNQRRHIRQICEDSHHRQPCEIW